MTTLSPSMADGRKLVGRRKSTAVRDASERVIMSSLILCGVFSVTTTALIIGVLCVETWKFFQFEEVGFFDFIFGLKWNPLLGEVKNFGIWPLIGSTMLVTAIAMTVALPLGLITAVYLSEYAPRWLRNILKPILEVIAGIPTVVFGFFALTVITPGLQFFSDAFGTYNAMAAGIAVGIMCLPIVTSLSEDALQAVPRALREAAYGMGATRFEVSMRVVVPAALSGIVAAFLLAIARAVGETMIVALAAGATPLPLSNIFEPPMVTHVYEAAGEDGAAGWDKIGTVPGAAKLDGDNNLAFSAAGRYVLDEFEIGKSEVVKNVTVHFTEDSAAAKASIELLRNGEVVHAAEGEAPTALTLSNLGEEERGLSGPAKFQLRFAVEGPATMDDISVLGERPEGLLTRLLIPVDPTSEVQPMTGYMVQIFLGDASGFGVEYYSAYAVACTLFFLTLALTLVGHKIRVKFRQEYD